MASVNCVFLLGNLGAKPELKYTPDGSAVCEMRLATTDKWTDKAGQKQERTEWHRVVAWKRTAELCAQYLDKGSAAHIQGRLQTRSWDDKDGNKRYMTEIVADRVQFIGGGGGGGGGEHSDAGGGDDGRGAGPAPAVAPAAAPAAGGGGDGTMLPPYGRQKGQPVYGQAISDLEFYANGCRRTLGDAAKERWHDKESILLAAIEREIARQRRGGDGGGGAPSDGGNGGEPPAWTGGDGSSDDDIPFISSAGRW